MITPPPVLSHLRRGRFKTLGVALLILLFAAFFLGGGISLNWLSLKVFGGLMALVGVPCLLIAIWGIARPDTHPTYQKLMTFGDPRHVAAAIDAEVPQTAPEARFGELDSWSMMSGPIYLTASWLVQFRMDSLSFARLDQVTRVKTGYHEIRSPQLVQGYWTMTVDDGSSPAEYILPTEGESNRLLLAILMRRPEIDVDE